MNGRRRPHNSALSVPGEGPRHMSTSSWNDLMGPATPPLISQRWIRPFLLACLCLLSAACSPTCRFCQSRTEEIPVVNGFPTPETVELAEEGKVVLGGCTGDADVVHQ